MFLWFRRLFSAPPAAPLLPREALPAESPPAWATELLDVVRKSSRTQARLSLQVEDLERKLEGGLAEWRDALSTQQTAPSSKEPPWDELLDARDLLEEAVHLADPAIAPGLLGVTDRLDRFLSRVGLTRLAPLGHPPDGRLFRVVGTQPLSGMPEGVISRVVRAAVLHGEHLLREGEAITVRNQP